MAFDRLFKDAATPADQSVLDAVHTLVEHRIAGAPVVDETGNLVGMLSELDCLKVVLQAGYHGDYGGPVRDFMTSDVQTVNAEMSIVDLAEKFLNSKFRRFPVMTENRLIGQISRRDVLRAQFETNVFGTLELTNRLLPWMREAGEGRIIQNSSVLGFVALAYRGAYNASKYALEGLSDTLRLELRGTDIHVSLVQPGPITSRFRPNAYLAYQRNIDPRVSVHRERYEGMEQRLTKEGPVVPFTLPPEAVLKKVIHALESPRPKPRYYVTTPTYLFGFLRRVLSTRALDALLRQASGGGKR